MPNLIKSPECRFVPSQADVAAFDSLKGACPDKAKYPHAARWYKHIESFEAAGRKQFPQGSGDAPKPAAAAKPAADDDDDVDLFGSDEENDEEAERVKQERVAAYAAKKSKKPALIAKTSVLLDVKPWDDETPMDKLKECVKTIQMDGLVWGADKFVPVGYGINKLQVSAPHNQFFLHRGSFKCTQIMQLCITHTQKVSLYSKRPVLPRNSQK